MEDDGGAPSRATGPGTQHQRLWANSLTEKVPGEACSRRAWGLSPLSLSFSFLSFSLLSDSLSITLFAHSVHVTARQHHLIREKLWAIAAEMPLRLFAQCRLLMSIPFQIEKTRERNVSDWSQFSNLYQWKRHYAHFGSHTACKRKGLSGIVCYWNYWLKTSWFRLVKLKTPSVQKPKHIRNTVVLYFLACMCHSIFRNEWVVALFEMFYIKCVNNRPVWDR